MECIREKNIQVLQSAAGYYIGTLDEGMPNCRVSAQYYKTREQAQAALDNNTYTTRNCMENEFCSGGTCFKTK